MNVNNTVCISLYNIPLPFKFLIKISSTFFTSLLKNPPYHGVRVRFKCHSINLLATKFLLLSGTKSDSISDNNVIWTTIV